MCCVIEAFQLWENQEWVINPLRYRAGGRLCRGVAFELGLWRRVRLHLTEKREQHPREGDQQQRGPRGPVRGTFREW